MRAADWRIGLVWRRPSPAIGLRSTDPRGCRHYPPIRRRVLSDSMLPFLRPQCDSLRVSPRRMASTNGSPRCHPPGRLTAMTAVHYPVPGFWNSLDFTALWTNQRLGGGAAVRLLRQSYATHQKCGERFGVTAVPNAPSQSESEPFKKKVTSASCFDTSKVCRPLNRASLDVSICEK